jgi:hypothetical protein
MSQREIIIKSALLDGLGTPDDLHTVIVKKLWNDDFYRVNVYRLIKGLKSITDSFFVHYMETEPKHHTITFSPSLVFKYYDGELRKVFNKEPNSLVKFNEADQELPRAA